jgi:uncharacterized membrane protein YbhN (UPF0104 family)
MTVPWLVGFPLLVLAARWFTSPRRLGYWTSESGGRARRGLGVGVSAAAFVRRYVRLGPAALGLWGAAIYWVADIISLGGGLRVVHVHIGPAALALAYATGYLAQMLPVPFLGTGGVDAATVACLSVFGVPLNAGLIGVLAHRLFAFWLPIIPGIILTAVLPVTGRALERVAHTQTA